MKQSDSKKLFIGAVSIIGVLLLIAAAFAAIPDSSRRSMSVRGIDGINPNDGLRVSGTATVRATPDLATVKLGHESRELEAREAKRANDRVMQKVISAMEQKGVDRKDIQTVEYRLYPMWEDWNGLQKKARVWHVLNMVEVRVRKVDTVADVIDAASTAGADKVENVEFSVENLHKLRSRAREMAAKVAREKAEQLAQLMGANLGEVISVTDNNEPNYPSHWYGYNASNLNAQMTLDQASTPSTSTESESAINGGQIVVKVREDVVYALE